MDDKLPRARRKTARPVEPYSAADTAPAQMRDSLTPTPEQEARMRAQVEDERTQRRMDDAYEQAAPRSMRRGFASGGAVGSASKRADGIAQRGKTKGRIL